MRHLLFGLLLVAAFAASGCDASLMSASLQVRSAPPPPAFAFREEPRFHYLSEFRVSVIADDDFGYDMFGCDGYYYLFSGGYWYRAPAPSGPFVVIETRRVPHRVFEVDDHRYKWRNHPPGWQGDWGRGHGRGHGHDRDHDDHGDDRGGDPDHH